jgi:glutamate-ammonia-ligase adenylyltransferase
MVPFSPLKNEEQFLFSEDLVPELKDLITENKNFSDSILNQILTKRDLSFAEEKYKYWVRHSLAFLSDKCSPKVITESWTRSVEGLLKKAWSKHFTEDDKIALAYMGKLGSKELNLSSDIDLIFFGENGYGKKVRAFIEEISAPDQIPSGFKLDFDLRPGGKDAPLVCTPKALGNHLWNNSDPWERYSYTRLRIVLGHEKIKSDVEEIVESFCYRKYLSSDFFHSFLSLRETYRDQLDESEVHVKLGEGGIRDVELFVQTFQILYGGKEKAFRKKSTFELIDQFIEYKIHPEIFKEVKQAFHFLRQAEGYLHALNPKGGFYWIEDKVKAKASFSSRLKESFETVKIAINDYTNSSENLFGSPKKKNTRNSFLNEIKKAIVEKGEDLEGPLENFSLFFSERNRRFTPYLNAILSQKSVKESFIDLLCYSKFGCQILSRRPNLLDHFLLRKYEVSDLKGEELLSFLADMKMVEKIVATNDFIKNKNLDTLGERLTNSYEFIIRTIMKEYGSIDFVFLGKISTKEIGIQSDLDFILIYDEYTNEKSKHLKEARKIFRDLSHSTIFGPLVPFDKNAGPMGTATPVVMSYEALKTYLREKAEPWQKLMYLRHRRLFKEDYINFLDKPINEEELSSLFKILEQRLFSTDLGIDRLKLEFGGLFHTEFIVGCLWLNIGKQPSGPWPIKNMCDELKEYYKDYSDDLERIKNNYEDLRKRREVSIIRDEHILSDEDYELLGSNGNTLELISSKVFNGKRVKRL